MLFMIIFSEWVTQRNPITLSNMHEYKSDSFTRISGESRILTRDKPRSDPSTYFSESLVRLICDQPFMVQFEFALTIIMVDVQISN